MAESVVKDFKGKMDWVYVGKAEAPKVVEKKADTLFNEYMRDVLDIATPVAKSELAEASALQGGIAEETANRLSQKSCVHLINKTPLRVRHSRKIS